MLNGPEQITQGDCFCLLEEGDAETRGVDQTGGGRCIGGQGLAGPTALSPYNERQLRCEAATKSTKLAFR